MDHNSAPMTKQDMQTILQAIQESESRVRSGLTEFKIELKSDLASLETKSQEEVANASGSSRDKASWRFLQLPGIRSHREQEIPGRLV